MNKSDICGLLTELGLSENEANVYLTLLSLGSTTALKVSRTTNLKRTTVYSVMESLKGKGLVSLEVRGFKTLVQAEGPEQLEHIIEDQRSRLQKTLMRTLPELSALHHLHGGESLVKYYEGLEAIKSVYEGLLRDIQPGQSYLTTSNPDQWFSLDQTYFQQFIERRAKLPIDIRLLLTNTPTALRQQQFQKNFNEHVRILPPQTILTTSTVVTPQRVVIHQLDQPLFAIVIENRSIIQMHQEYFEIMWNSASSR